MDYYDNYNDELNNDEIDIVEPQDERKYLIPHPSQSVEDNDDFNNDNEKINDQPKSAIFFVMINHSDSKIRLVGIVMITLIIFFFFGCISLFSYAVKERNDVYCNKPLWIILSGIGLVLAGQTILGFIHVIIPLNRFYMRLAIGVAVIMSFVEVFLILLGTIWLFQVEHKSCNKNIKYTTISIIVLSWLTMIIGVAVKFIRTRSEQEIPKQYWKT